MSNRICGVLAPQIVALSSVSLDIHFIIFGVLGLFAAGLTLLLPETLGKPLPEQEKDVISLNSPDRQQLLNDVDDEHDSSTTRI